MKQTLVILALSLPLLAPASWWESFGSPELNQLIERGLNAHPSSRAALAAVESSRATQRAARSQRGPSVTAQAGLRWGQEKTMYTNREVGDTDLFAASAKLSWEVDLYNRVKNDLTAADAGIERAKADENAVRLALSTEIASSAFTLSLLQDQFEIHQQRVKIAERLLRRSQARFHAGLQSKSDSDKQNADLQMVAHMASLTEIAMQKEQARLQSLVPGTETVELGTISIPAIREPVVKRPDVAAAWWRAQEAGALASSAGASRYPKLEIVASAAGEGSESDVEPWEAWAGPVLSIPLWEPKRKAGSDKAAAMAAEAKAEFERVSLTAMREMNVARVDLKNADHMREHMEERQKSLQEVQDRLQARRDAGLIQEDEVANAESKQLLAKLEALEWQTAEWLAHVEWIRATGSE